MTLGISSHATLGGWFTQLNVHVTLYIWAEPKKVKEKNGRKMLEIFVRDSINIFRQSISGINTTKIRKECNFWALSPPKHHWGPCERDQQEGIVVDTPMGFTCTRGT